MAVPDARGVGHSHLPDGSERIDIGSRLYQSSAHVGPDTNRQTFDGRPPRNEDDVPDVCAVLRDALNNSGETWGTFQEPTSPADDIDAVAVNDAGQRLRVQVVRVEQAAWAELGRTGHADRALAARELVSAVLRAVEKKAQHYPQAQRRGLLLALDAFRAPGYAFKQVVDVISDEHAEQIAQHGFEAVWLVGPTAALTFRLA